MPDRPLSEWIDKWLSRREMDVSQSTVEKNRYHAKHIKNHLGDLPLKEIDFTDVETFYARLKDDLADNTIRSIHGTLSKCFSDLVRSPKIPIEHNPCSEANPPDEQTKTFNVLTPDEARTLRRTLFMKDPYDVCIYLALQTGMRKSELLGLTWEHLDLDRGVIEVVNKRTKTPDGNWEEGSLKSKSSYRSVKLCPETQKRMKLYKQVQYQRQMKAEDWPCPEYVFTSQEGTHLFPRNIKRRLDKHLEECGIKKIRFHDLRHTHATILLKQDKHPEKVKERLGHGSVDVTMKRYSHVTLGMQDDLVEAFNEALQ